MLERDVLPARVDGYRPGMLDELCAAGELVWIGAGALGADDGRVRLFFRDRVRLLATRPALDGAPDGEIHDAIRDRLLRAGASFWPELVAATGTADDAVVLTALWDLVWAGEVTNDTFGPLRVPAARPRRKPSGRARPHPGRLTRLGPPAGAGRWSLVVPLLEPEPTPTERAHAAALQLLERQGVVTREAVRAEGAAGGFAGVYPGAARARGVGPGPAGLVRRRARRRAVRAPGRGRPAARAPHDRRREPGPRARARGHRSRPALRRRAVLARAPGRVGAAVALRGRVRRARRRRVRGVPRTRRQGADHVHAGGNAAETATIDRRGPRRSSRRTSRAAWPASRSSASTTSPRARRRTPPRSARPVSPTVTRASRSGSLAADSRTLASEVDMGFLDKVKDAAGKAADQAKHATAVGKEKIEDARLQKKINDLCQEIGALVVAQKRNEAPEDARRADRRQGRRDRGDRKADGSEQRRRRRRSRILTRATSTDPDASRPTRRPAWPQGSTTSIADSAASMSQSRPAAFAA